MVLQSCFLRLAAVGCPALCWRHLAPSHPLSFCFSRLRQLMQHCHCDQMQLSLLGYENFKFKFYVNETLISWQEKVADQ